MNKGFANGIVRRQLSDGLRARKQDECTQCCAYFFLHFGEIVKIRIAVHIKCDECVCVCVSCMLRSFPNVKYLMKWLFSTQASHFPR